MKKDMLLLGSAAAALVLFAIPSKIMLLLEAAIFFAIALSVRLGCCSKSHSLTAGIALLAGLFTGIGIYWFLTSPKSFEPPVAVALVCGLAACYAFYCLANRIDEWICGLLRVSPEGGTAAKWKANWWFPVSAAACFLMEAATRPDPEYLCSVLAAVGVSAVVACRAPSLPAKFASDPWPQKLLCVLSAAGISLFQVEKLCRVVPEQAMLGCLGVVSFFFVYFCVSALYGRVGKTLKRAFADVSSRELVLYGGMLLVTLCVLTAVFLRTDAFYGTDYPYDIVYTSDSPTLLQENVYLSLTNEENDLRQPLFAVFSAPFIGLPYLISRAVGASPAVHALLLNYPQILLLFAANVLLAGLLKLTGGKRMVFLLLAWFSYPTMLFIFMMEQYIVAFFYLILLVYSACESEPDPVALSGATGAMLTSAAMLPLMSEKRPLREFSGWYGDMLNAGLGLVIAILAFGRLDVLLEFADRFLNLNRFSGESLSIVERFYQYTAFLYGCLLAPAGQVCENMWGNISWQLVPAHGVCVAGLVLLALATLSAVWNRDRKSCRVAFCWLLFSLLILVGYGWGTQENGLILYSLYFGWTFLTLLYQLVGKAECRWNVKYLTVTVGLVASAVMLAVNAIGISKIISFAISNYPI